MSTCSGNALTSQSRKGSSAVQVLMQTNQSASWGHQQAFASHGGQKPLNQFTDTNTHCLPLILPCTLSFSITPAISHFCKRTSDLSPHLPGYRRKAPQAISTMCSSRREDSGSNWAKSEVAALPSLCAELTPLLPAAQLNAVAGAGWWLGVAHPPLGRAQLLPSWRAMCVRLSLGRHRPAWSRQRVLSVQSDLTERHPIRKKNRSGEKSPFQQIRVGGWKKIRDWKTSLRGELQQVSPWPGTASQSMQMAQTSFCAECAKRSHSQEQHHAGVQGSLEESPPNIQVLKTAPGICCESDNSHPSCLLPFKTLQSKYCFLPRKHMQEAACTQMVCAVLPLLLIWHSLSSLLGAGSLSDG